MYECECGRVFTKKQGLSRHKKYCGKNNNFYDAGYKCKIGNDGRVVYIHREVMEQKLGRKLEKGEVVHHIDENKENNEPDNLELTNFSLHAKHHLPIGGIPTGLNRKSLKGIKTGSNPKKISQSKLTEEQVITIKNILKKNKKIIEVAKLFNIGYDAVHRIKKGTSWKHVII